MEILKEGRQRQNARWAKQTYSRFVVEFLISKTASVFIDKALLKGISRILVLIECREKVFWLGLIGCREKVFWLGLR